MSTANQGAVAMQPQGEVPSVGSETAAILQIIERAARDPAVDMDKMERLMAWREREMARSAENAFNAAMQAAQAEMPQVVRDASNEQTKSRYARYETISEAIQPVITKHGFSLSYGEADSTKERHIRIVCDVLHRDGHTKQYHADIPIDDVGMKGNANKTATHAYGSTKSYGKRYLKCDIFDVAVKNEDDDGNKAGQGATITEEQVMELRELIDEVGAKVEAFCNIFRIESLPDLPAKAFKVAVERLQEFGAQKRAG